MEYFRVSEDGDVAEKQLVSVSLQNGDQVCLARVGGVVYAVEDRCSHAEFPLSDGSLEDGCTLECALHGAVFDLRDGSAVGPPAEEPVRTYSVKVEDGGIWIGVGASD